MRRSAVRVICSLLAAACLMAAAGRLGFVALQLADPVATTTGLRCDGAGCRLAANPLRLLPDRTPLPFGEAAAADAVRAQVAQSAPRLMLAAAAGLTAAPFLVICLALAAVFRFCARGEPFDQRAIRWVRRVAIAGLVATALKPLATGLSSAAVLPALGVPDPVRFSVDLGAFSTGLFVSGALWAAAWAMGQAREFQHEAEHYV